MASGWRKLAGAISGRLRHRNHDQGRPGPPVACCEPLEPRRLLAVPGSLDQLFDGDGKVGVDFGPGWSDWGRDVIVQPDGKIVVGGVSSIPANGLVRDAFSFARFNLDGSPDSAFGTGGRVSLDTGMGASLNALALQDDGKIVAAGRRADANSDLYQSILLRLNPDGSPDSGFDGDGVIATDERLEYRDVAITAQNRIVAVGDDARTLIVARFNSNGAPDNTFDGDGRAEISFGENLNFGGSLAIESSGRITVAGRHVDGAFAEFPGDIILARLNSDGSLDEATFGNQGKVRIHHEGSDGAGALALLPDGKILVGGGWAQSDSLRASLLRFNSNGDPDTSFGGDGVVDLGRFGVVLDLVVQDTGKIVTVEEDFGGEILENNDFKIRRYHANGLVDPDFLVADFGGDLPLGKSIAAWGDKVVAVGDYDTPAQNSDFGVMRVNGGPLGELLNEMMSNGNDTVHIRRNGIYAEIFVNHSSLQYPTFVVALEDMHGLALDTLGGNDRLIIDMTSGTPLSIAEMSFEDGTGTDQLEIRGSDGINDIILGHQFVSLGFLAGVVRHTAPEHVVVDGGGGDDRISVGEDRLTSGIGGTITIIGGDGIDSAIINDEQAAGSVIYNLEGFDFTTSGPFGQLVYLAEEVILNTGGGNAGINVQSIIAGTAVTVSGGAGDDEMYVARSTNLLETIDGPLTFNGGGGNDSVRLQDGSHAAAETYDVHATTVSTTRTGMTPASVTLQYDQVESVFIDAANDHAGVFNVHATRAGTVVTINSSSSNDTFNITPVGRNLGAIQGELVLERVGGDDELVIDDGGFDLFSLSTVTSGRFVSASRSAPINYSSLLRRLTYHNGPGGSLTTVESLGGSLILDLNGNGGVDSFVIGEAATGLAPLLNADDVNISGGGDNDSITIHDEPNALNHTYSLDAQRFDKSGFSQLDFAGVERLTLYAGSGNNSISVGDTQVPTSVNAGAGNDTVTLGAALSPISAELSVHGQEGTDTINVVETGANVRVIVKASPGDDVVNVNSDAVGFAAALFDSPIALGSLNGRANSRTDLAAGGTTVLSVNQLVLAPSARLDLHDNDLIVRGGDLAAVTQAVRSARTAIGDWSGFGITSSAAASDPVRRSTVGIALAGELGVSTFAGQSVLPGDVLARYTLYGDATLDRSVDFNDLARVAQNYNSTGKTIAGGNFNYDENGTVDFIDLAVLAQNYNSTLTVPASGGMGESGGGMFNVAGPPARPAARPAPRRRSN
jgi:uncharacterized delta-60 repeat protein